MKHLLLPLLTFSTLLLCDLSAPLAALAQDPVTYIVEADCPGTSGSPSNLRRLQGAGTTNLGQIQVAGVGVPVNGLGFDSGDPTRAFALGVNTMNPFAVPLYQINLTNGAATNLGNVAPPPPPVSSPLGLGSSTTLNLIGDGSQSRQYYIAGVSFRYNFFAPPGSRFNSVSLHLGEIDVSLPVVSPVPVWRTITLDATTQTLLNAFVQQCEAYFAGTGPLPEGGFQDWLFDPVTNRLISYLGVEQRFSVVSNLSTTPSAVTTTPSPLLPVALQVGGMYRDVMNNVFVIVSDNGRAYQINRTNGNYLGTFVNTGLGCFRGDAATAPPIVTLPVELVSFSAGPCAGGVRLDWRTASERAAESFIVERADPARDGWRTVATVAATNHASGARYSAVDPSPNGTSARYRLVMLDHDGTRSVSTAVEVRFLAQSALLVPYPNPTSGAFEVLLTAPAPAGSSIELVDARGQTVWQQTLLTGALRANVPAPQLGVYHLIATLGGQRATHRVVVTP